MDQLADLVGGGSVINGAYPVYFMSKLEAHQEVASVAAG